MRIVVAIGGNAIQPRGATGGIAEQRATLFATCGQLAELAEAGHELVISHGNGPQVGRLLELQRAEGGDAPAMPLDVLVAQTQGMVGLLIQQELAAALREHAPRWSVTTIVTQVVVEAEDPAFSAPDKPVGPHHTETELEFLLGRAATPGADRWTVDGVTYAKTEHRAWRRVVASPHPIEIVEQGAIVALLESGSIPVCAGGGGAPVVRGGGRLHGTEAVVDKDRTAALLVRSVGADALLILTDVDEVRLGFGTPEERPLAVLELDEARRLLEEGEFSPGTMGPKIAAAIEVAARGGLAVISSLEQAVAALEGRAGTRFVPAPPPPMAD